MLVGVGVAFVIVALVLYLMLRGATEEASQSPAPASPAKLRRAAPLRHSVRDYQPNTNAPESE